MSLLLIAELGVSVTGGNLDMGDNETHKCGKAWEWIIVKKVVLTLECISPRLKETG